MVTDPGPGWPVTTRCVEAPRSRRGRTRGTGVPAAPTMSPDIDGEIEDEVTRVEYVEYLEGATGHAVFSTLFLAVGAVFLVRGPETVGWGLVGIATAISANGLSIYGWDRLRERFRVEERSEGPDRELTYHRPSNETQAEVKAGFVMLAALVGGLLLVNAGLEYLGVRRVVYLFVVFLGAGNVGALALAIRSSGRE